MNRRQVLLGLLASAACAPAAADWKGLLNQAGSALGGASGPGPGGLAAGLTQGEVAGGLKQALEVGIRRAVEALGQPGGFLDDPGVRIPLPASLQRVESGLRAAGQGWVADELVTTMNRAAERAVPETVGVFTEAIRGMTLDDAAEILNGPQDAATRYLRRTSGERLQSAIRPIVEEATAAVNLTAAYKRMTAGLGGMLGGFMDPGSLDLDGYVTAKAVDGLFVQLGQEEARIRENPAARSTELLQKVFGAA
ncbi:MAG: DUF4197 domain-containing protein [Chromatiales bacterium]|jgi:hypothetical protein